MKKKYVKPEVQDLRLPILVAGGMEPRGVCQTGITAGGGCSPGDAPTGGTDCSNGTNPSGVCNNGTAVLYCTSGDDATTY